MVQQLIDFLHYIFDFFTFRTKPENYVALDKEELLI
jgi:hypothetical protein